MRALQVQKNRINRRARFSGKFLRGRRHFESDQLVAEEASKKFTGVNVRAR